MEFVKKFDFLSPPITLYFKGEDLHASLFSALLTVVVYVLVFVAAIYYFLGFVNKDSPKAYFFTRYVEDAGNFPVNASSMFNYVQFIDKYDSTKLGFDFSVLKAVGVNSIYYDQYMSNPEVIDDTSYWVYGPCNDNTDIKGIEDLIDPVVYNNAACIREYYNKDENRYYKTGEKGFIWPVIERGCSNPKGTFYGIIVQRCDNAPASLKRDGIACRSSSDITDRIANLSFKYQIMDQYADMLNYKMPFTKYFYDVASAIQDGIFIINHLNFNPADMLTHNGIFFDNQVVEKSYFFTQNEKHTVDQSTLEDGQTTNGCLISVYFWMQNTLQHYERTYDRFQDLLSDIGGISSIITTLGYYINLLVNYYIALVDTEELIINRDEMNYVESKNFTRRPTFIRKVKQIENPPRRPYRPVQRNLTSKNIMKESPNSQSDAKYEEINIYNNSRMPYRNPYNKAINIANETNQADNLDFVKDIGTTKTVEKNTKESIEEMPIQKKDFNWFRYIWYLIRCKSNDQTISYFENIRTSLISEENIIQNYLDIYKLLQLNGFPKKDIFNNRK